MRQLLVITVLVLLMQVAIHYGISGGGTYDAVTLFTVGFILVGGYTMGELFRRMRLPALIGYLATGILFGPKLVGLVLGDPSLAPVGEGPIESLELVNVLAVGVIGTIGGGEMKLADLRENFTRLGAICLMVFVVVLPLLTAVVLGLTFVAPGLIPFLAELPLAGRIAGALLFGALGVGMSPAATLALMQEVHAEGRFTSLVLGVVVIADLMLVGTFLVVLALAKLLISPEGLTMASLGAELPHIAMEFGWAIGLGVAVGVVFILYLQFVRREVLLTSLVLVFVTAFVASRLHAETLLAFLVAGFTVQNFSSHGHTLVEAFERIALPVFVVYFTIQAAALDLVAVTTYLPLTLILLAARSGLLVLGVSLGARWAGIDDATRGRLNLSFFSKGGVDLVLAVMIAEGIPGWGVEVQTVTMAMILFYIVGGPPLLARALDGAGESAAARERGAEELASQGPGESSRRRGPAFMALTPPSATDPALAQRLHELHSRLLGLRDDLIERQLLARARRRRVVIEELSLRVGDALEALGPEPDATEATRVRDELDAAVAEAATGIDRSTVAPFDGATLLRLFDALEGAQEFSQSFRVPRDEALFEARGGQLERGLRALRRLRRSLLGPGQRTVPVGRLWRYYVSLSVPVGLWKAVRPAEASLWHDLYDHYRRTRAQLDAVADGSWSSMPAPGGSAASRSGAAVSRAELDEGGQDDAAAEGEEGEAGEGAEASTASGTSMRGADLSPAPPTLELWLDGARDAARSRETEIVRRLVEVETQLEAGLLEGLAVAWRDFLGSVSRAGTLELPAWRTRPSRRYDASKAATAELLERSGRDREAAAGRLDALLARAHAEHVATTIHSTALEFEQGFTAVLDELEEDFDRATALVTEAEGQVPDPVAFGQALVVLGEHAGRLRRQLVSLAQREPPALAAALAAVPATLAPSTSIEAEGRDASPRRTQIRLRTWLTQTLAHDFGLARASAEEELEAGLDGLRDALAHTGRVADYHLLDNAPAFDEGESGTGLGARLLGLLESSRQQVHDLARLARDHVEDTVAAAERAGLDPIRNGDWEELHRRQRRFIEGPRAEMLEWIRGRAAAWGRRIDALRRGVGDELSALFADRYSPGAVEAWRSVVFGARSSMPEAYQRLYTSVPAETVGLLIQRPELAALESHARRRLDEGGAILLYGDDGVGKRSLARQLAGRLSDTADLRWVRVPSSGDAERELASELAPALGMGRLRGTPSLQDLARQARTLGPARRPGFPGTGARSGARRPMVVIEHAERLFRRRPAGLAAVRRLLELVRATDDRVLWVVLVSEPVIPLLDTAMEFSARFASALRVPPMSAAQIEEVLRGRHVLSGYRLYLEPGTPTLGEWLRDPKGAFRQWRGSAGATFERIATLSGGNVRQAMRLWLAVARLDEQGQVIIGALPAQACPLAAELPLSSRLMLAALLLHGPLPCGELIELHGPDSVDLDAELTRLSHLGLIRFEDAADARARVVSVETRLVQPLTSELRACNLL